jgi:hypothetical protein
MWFMKFSGPLFCRDQNDEVGNNGETTNQFTCLGKNHRLND